MHNDPFVIFLLIIAGLFLALEIYVAYLNFISWLNRKILLLGAAWILIRASNKEVRSIGWNIIRLVFWETKDDEKCSTDKDKE